MADFTGEARRPRHFRLAASGALTGKTSGARAFAGISEANRELAGFLPAVPLAATMTSPNTAFAHPLGGFRTSVEHDLFHDGAQSETTPRLRRCASGDAGARLQEKRS